MWFLTLLVFIFILGIIVLVHELGHILLHDWNIDLEELKNGILLQIEAGVYKNDLWG